MHCYLWTPSVIEELLQPFSIIINLTYVCDTFKRQMLLLNHTTLLQKHSDIFWLYISRVGNTYYFMNPSNLVTCHTHIKRHTRTHTHGCTSTHIEIERERLIDRIIDWEKGRCKGRDMYHIVKVSSPGIENSHQYIMAINYDVADKK